MIRLSGACLGLLAFSVAIFAGLSAGNPPIVILSRAVWAMVVFVCVGSFAGWVAVRILHEYARHRQQQSGCQQADSRTSQPDAQPQGDGAT